MADAPRYRYRYAYPGGRTFLDVRGERLTVDGVTEWGERLPPDDRALCRGWVVEEVEEPPAPMKPKRRRKHEPEPPAESTDDGDTAEED